MCLFEDHYSDGCTHGKYKSFHTMRNTSVPGSWCSICRPTYTPKCPVIDSRASGRLGAGSPTIATNGPVGCRRAPVGGRSPPRRGGRRTTRRTVRSGTLPGGGRTTGVYPPRTIHSHSSPREPSCDLNWFRYAFCEPK